jgi:hypothetical protein
MTLTVVHGGRIRRCKDVYCVLLPYKKKDIPFKLEYAIVCLDWDVISNGEKVVPSLSRTLFAVDVLP